MPDLADPDRRLHPKRVVGARQVSLRSRRQGRLFGGAVDYVELRCKSNFSFLQGASHPEELVERADALGYPALGIADVNTLAGVVRAHCAAKGRNLKLLLGVEVTPVDGPAITLYAMNRFGYGRLARLITVGRRRAKKGECHLTTDDVLAHHEGLIAIVHDGCARSGADDPSRGRKGPGQGPRSCARGSEGRCGVAHGDCDGCETLRTYREAFAGRLYLGAQIHGNPMDGQRVAMLADRSREMRVPLVAVNDVHYHESRRRFLQDVLVCVREGCRLTDAGKRLFPNGERYLKSAEAMSSLFHMCPEAVVRTREVADRCTFSLDELRYEYPPELCPPGRTPAEHLAELTWAGAEGRYPQGVPDKVRRIIEHELVLIAELRYEHYFLTVWDLVRYARSRGILCQGRGSAANSAVCFCLGVTSVDPDRVDLLFERFVSAERNEPPDIDVDFEHERREEVIQYIYDKYGRDRAGIAAEVITYRPKSAVRDVGKALGFSLDRLGAIAKTIDWWSDPREMSGHLSAAGFDPNDHTVRCMTKLCADLIGFPRHLSQHVGGFVMTAGPLCEMAPIENAAMPDRTFIEWDKDDIDALGILKVDCLSLGMLTAIRKGFDFVAEQCPLAGFEEEGSDPRVQFARMIQGCDANQRLALVPPEDPRVYAMICRADTVGVFQIESRAQMSMLPRLRPRCFYDLVIEVAIVRPGPIQGGMVHPYLRRRNGEEPVSYPSREVEAVLKKTLGVPLFQEQAMKLAMVAAGFTPGEADQLRRSMAAWKRHGSMDKFRSKLIGGMLEKGYDAEFAERLFNQLRGFGEYGFPESHAASFALLVYASSWLKRYFPAVFAAAVINSQPMGFYAPAQLVRDAREHGVPVRGIDINRSHYDCTLEDWPRRSNQSSDQSSNQSLGRKTGGQGGSPADTWGADGPALRLGFRLIKGISRSAIDGITSARRAGVFRSVTDVARRGGAGRGVLARLAAADAFGSMGLNRRVALWDVLALDEELPLFAGSDQTEEPATLPGMSLAEKVTRDYETTGLSLRAHPMLLVRSSLEGSAIVTARTLRSTRQGRRVNVAGLVLVRQRPSTALGIVFMTIEDETGVANLVVRPKVYERFQTVAKHATALVASGRIERQGEVVHVQVERLASVRSWIASLRVRSRDFH